MKILLLYLLIISSFYSYAQHTFSIVAVDRNTGEIGSAGATCIAAEDGARDVSVIIPGVGAIHTQSFWNPTNQQNATTRMQAGDSPQQIMNWLVANDINNDPSQRQYIAVDLNNGEPRSAGFTGSNCIEEFIHLTGPGYAIAGNILISEDVIKDMEQAFMNTQGTLAEKLMASLQAAKRPGADVRCLDDGISSASAFIRVANPSDTDSSYGNLSLDLNVWITNESFEPIDALQNAYDEFVLGKTDPKLPNDFITLFPNPTHSLTRIRSNTTLMTGYCLFDIKGLQLECKQLNRVNKEFDLNLTNYENGIYFLNITNGPGSVQKRIVKF